MVTTTSTVTDPQVSPMVTQVGDMLTTLMGNITTLDWSCNVL